MRAPPESTTRRKRNAKCTHLDWAGDSTIEVVDGRAWCAQCGEGKPREPDAVDIAAAARTLEKTSRLVDEAAERAKKEYQ